MFAQSISIDGPETTFVNETFPLEVTLHNANLGNLGGIGIAYEYRYLWSSGTTPWIQSGSQKSLRPSLDGPVTIHIKPYNPGPRTVEVQLYLYKGYEGPARGQRIDGTNSNVFRYDVIKINRPDPLPPEKPKDTFIFEGEIYVVGTPSPPPTISDPSDPWSPPVIDDSCPVGADGQMLKITKIYGIDGEPLNPNINALRVTTSGEIKIAFDIARFEGLEDGAIAYHQYKNLAKANAPWKRSPPRNSITFTLPGNTESYTIPSYTDDFIIGEECEDELRELLLSDINKPGPRAVRLVVPGGNEDGGDYVSDEFPFVIGQEPFICEGNVLKFNTVGKRTKQKTIRVSITNPDNAPGLFYAPIYIYTDGYGNTDHYVGGGFSIDGGCVQDYVLNIADAPVIEGYTADYFAIRLRPRVAGSAWIDSAPTPMNN